VLDGERYHNFKSRIDEIKTTVHRRTGQKARPRRKLRDLCTKSEKNTFIQNWATYIVLDAIVSVCAPKNARQRFGLAHAGRSVPTIHKGLDVSKPDYLITLENG